MLRDWIIRWWCRRKLKQQHIDFSFSPSELTLSIEDFAKRYIDPAIEQLAADLTADFIAKHGLPVRPVWYKRCWSWLRLRFRRKPEPKPGQILLNVDQITAKALGILHQKANLLGAVDQAYDEQTPNR